MASGSLPEIALALSKSVALAAAARLYWSISLPTSYRASPAPAAAAAAAMPATSDDPPLGIAASIPSPIASSMNSVLSSPAPATMRTLRSTIDRWSGVACIWSKVTRRRCDCPQTLNPAPISGLTVAMFSSRSSISFVAVAPTSSSLIADSRRSFSAAPGWSAYIARDGCAATRGRRSAS